jgi:hypothetical protein
MVYRLNLTVIIYMYINQITVKFLFVVNINFSVVLCCNDIKTPFQWVYRLIVENNVRSLWSYIRNTNFMLEVVQPYNYVKHGHLHLYFYLKQSSLKMKRKRRLPTKFLAFGS